MRKDLFLIVAMVFGLACVISFLLEGSGEWTAEGRTITVDDDGEAEFTNIQEAINASEDGDTVRVWEGKYYENVTVNKSITIQGNGSKSVIRSHDVGNVVNITSDNVTFDGFKIRIGEKRINMAGVRMEGNHSILSNLTIIGHYYGIHLVSSYFCSVNDNRISSCERSGIKLNISAYVTVRNNTCNLNNDDGVGIYLYLSSWNEIINNTCTNNGWGIAGGIGFYNNITGNVCNKNDRYGIQTGWTGNYWNITNNTCNSNEIGIVIESDGAQVRHNSCDNNEVAGLLLLGDSAFVQDITCTNGLNGMQITGSENIFIEGECSSNRDGIQVGGYGNEFFKITVAKNNIGFWISGENISITDCLVFNNTWGILVRWGSDNITLSSNQIANNWVNGLRLESNSLVHAANNWWGHISGPYHSKQNRRGGGDEISGSAEFKPWLLSSKDGLFSSRLRDDPDEDHPWLYGVIGVITVGAISFLGVAFFREDLRFLILALLTTPLYSRLEKDDILEQPKRQEIFSYIVNQPGSNLTKLHRELPIGYGTLVHHLKVLEREKHIRSKKEMGRKLFFPTGTDWVTKITSAISAAPREESSAGSANAFSGVGGGPDSLENLSSVPVGLRIIEYLKENGPATQKEIEDTLKLKQTTVSYNIRMLEDEGKIEGNEEKRGAVYRLLN